MSTLSTIWKNTNGCAYKYRCATALYLMSVLSQRHSIIFDRGISEPEHGKYVEYGLNAIDKRQLYKLISTVQLPGQKTFEKILIYSSTPKKDVSLAKEPQKHLSKDDRKHGFIDQGKDRKISSKRKWIDIQYNVQDNADVAHKDVKMYCDTNQLPTLPFCGSHPKLHGSRRLDRHYHILFDPNIGNVICAIIRIPCACVACTTMLD